MNSLETRAYSKKKVLPSKAAVKIIVLFADGTKAVSNGQGSWQVWYTYESGHKGLVYI
jgi:hypothetical protein